MFEMCVNMFNKVDRVLKFQNHFSFGTRLNAHKNVTNAKKKATTHIKNNMKCEQNKSKITQKCEKTNQK